MLAMNPLMDPSDLTAIQALSRAVARATSRADSRALYRASHNLAHSAAHNPTALPTSFLKARSPGVSFLPVKPMRLMEPRRAGVARGNGNAKGPHAATATHHTTCHTTRHTTHHKATFTTLRVKASFSERNAVVAKYLR